MRNGYAACAFRILGLIMSDNKDKLRAWKAQHPALPVPDRNKMVAALKSDVVPQIREYGFSGSFPHFRRFGPTKTDFVTFQFDKYGGGFVVELGEGPTDELVYPWGERKSAKKLTTFDLDLARRTRLAIGPPSAGEKWFDTIRGPTKHMPLRPKKSCCCYPKWKHGFVENGPSTMSDPCWAIDMTGQAVRVIIRFGGGGCGWNLMNEQSARCIQPGSMRSTPAICSACSP